MTLNRPVEQSNSHIEAVPDEAEEEEATQEEHVHETIPEVSEPSRYSREGTPIGYRPADQIIFTDENFETAEPSQWLTEEPATQQEPEVAPHRRVAELRSGAIKKSSRKRSSRKSPRRSGYEPQSDHRNLWARARR
ncbi:hypothetical protein VMCG_00538 [Cytospora schulzeri]|uniref:Uncharacterized protein n=1 Tax=Cytospora schulzeri TaxID=448051 RepID=A0A423X7R1_9PEZI|nr:hypothetical protein VMCG_00538 [Valsa malicola]